MERTDDFLVWYSRRRERQTGHPLTKATVDSMRSRVGTAYTASGADTPEAFAQLLGVEVRANTLLDVLAERNSTGALRLVYEACKAFHGYALSLGWELPAFAMERPAKNPRRAVRVYGADEVDRLVGAALGISLHWYAFLAVFVHTGRRVNEVLSLRWEWLHLEADTPYFELPFTKNKRQAYVPLDSFLLGHVFTPENVERMKMGGRFRVRAADEYVFPWAQEKQVRRMLERHCARVDVPYLGFHCFRHTHATEMLARGVPMHVVSALLGHASVRTTDSVYNHTTALTFARYLETDDAEVEVSEVLETEHQRVTSTGNVLGIVPPMEAPLVPATSEAS